MTDTERTLRALSPSEQATYDAIITPMSAKQIEHATGKPKGTVACALANLCNCGLVTRERKPTLARNASRNIYRRAKA